MIGPKGGADFLASGFRQVCRFQMERKVRLLSPCFCRVGYYPPLPRQYSDQYNRGNEDHLVALDIDRCVDYEYNTNGLNNSDLELDTFSPSISYSPIARLRG